MEVMNNFKKIYIIFFLSFYLNPIISKGVRVTTGVRYILAGFCNYIEKDVSTYYNIFSHFYNPTYDGFAFQFGLRIGDQITHIEVCKQNYGDVPGLGDRGGDLSSLVTREYVEITPNVNDIIWKEYADSCESLFPYNITRIKIVRKQEEEVTT